MIKLQHKHLRDMADFLMSIGAKGKENIDRMRIVNAITEKNQQFSEEEMALIKEFGKKDSNGDLVQFEGGGFALSDPKAFTKQQAALMDEYYVIDDTNLQSALNTVKDLVNVYDEEINGKHAEMHFILIQAFEGGDKE